jgi:ParB family chromosome partitioning protein
VTNTLRLLQLPASIQRLLGDGRLSPGHARALLGTPDRSFQEQLARRAASEQWSVRQVEEAVRDRSAPATAARASRPAPKLRPPGLLELEQLLADHLDTRVAIQMGAGRGRVMVEFADLEDLERIYRAMTEAPQADAPQAPQPQP